MSRNFAPKPYPALSAEVHSMVLRPPSGLTTHTIAELTGYGSYNTMMSELSGQPGHKLGADKLLPLMDACDSNAPLVFLARQRHGVFLELPEAAGGSGCLVQELARTIREFSEFAATTAEHISDGLIEAHELPVLTAKGHEAVEAIMSMIKLARITHQAQFGGTP